MEFTHFIWSWDGEPFGATPANENVSPTTTFTYNLRFPGQYYDKESGLHQNRWREYDPRQGKYLQSDPIGLAAGVNTYAYVGSSPLMFVDPLGLWATSAHNAIIDEAFKGLPTKYIEKIKEGSAAVDAMANQIGDTSYMHAMTAPGQSEKDAYTLACAFIRKNLALYFSQKNLSYDKNVLQAYYYLGKAMHPIMDSTSPQHQGWQVWDPHLKDIINKRSQPWQHGNNSPEDLAHLTPELKKITVDKMLKALKTNDCSCLN